MEKLTLCILDDDKSLTETYSLILSPYYQVSCYQSGADALAAFDAGYNPDILITDLKMPFMDGFGFIDALRQRGMTNPLIVISGNAEKSDTLKAIDKEVFGFLEKPMNRDKLLGLVKRAALHRLCLYLDENLMRRFISLSQNMNKLSRKYVERFGEANEIAQDIPEINDEKQFMEFVKNSTADHELARTIEKDSSEIDETLEKWKMFLELTKR